MSKGVKLLVGLLGAHVALGVARVPGKVYGRRLDEVAAYREQGAAAFLCGRARLGGADALTWLLEHTDEREHVRGRRVDACDPGQSGVIRGDPGRSGVIPGDPG